MANWSIDNFYFGRLGTDEDKLFFEFLNRAHFDHKEGEFYAIRKLDIYGSAIRFHGQGRWCVEPPFSSKFAEWLYSGIVVRIYSSEWGEMSHFIHVNGELVYERTFDLYPVSRPYLWNYEGKTVEEKTFFAQLLGGLNALERNRFENQAENLPMDLATDEEIAKWR